MGHGLMLGALSLVIERPAIAQPQQRLILRRGLPLNRPIALDVYGNVSWH